MFYKLFVFFNRLISSPVYANPLSDKIGQELSNTTDAQDEVSLANKIVRIAIPAAALALIVLLSWGGYNMITSQGNPDKLQEAKEVVTNAVIGFLVIALSVAILLLISNVLNLQTS